MMSVKSVITQSKVDNVEKHDAGAKQEGKSPAAKTKSTDYFMSPVVTTLSDVNARLFDCDDENVTWRHRIDMATDAVGSVSDNCDVLFRRFEDSTRAYKLLQGENQRLQNRMKATNEMLEVALRHRFVPDVDDDEPGYMVKRLEASLPPSAFD